MNLTATKLHRLRRVGPVAWLRGVVTRPRVGLAVVLVVIVAYVGLAVWRSYQTVEAQQQVAEATRTLDEVVDPVAALCADDPTVRARLGDQVCFAAQRAAQAPPAAVQGEPGMDGRGIVATVIRADGHLVVSYTDGARIDVGAVVGAAGEPGRGISGSEIADGRLVLRFSDGTVQDVGPVVGARGAAGRGITSTAIVGGRLVVTYTDGATQDAGEVPAGPPGEDAELPARYTNTYPDGTSETCTRAGGEDSAPVYDCTERA